MAPRVRIGRSFWGRFALSYIAIFTLSLVIIWLVTLWIGQAYLRDQLRTRILTEVRFLQFEYDEGGLAELMEETEERIDRREPKNPLLYMIANAQGEVIFDPFAMQEPSAGWQTLRREYSDGSVRDFLFFYTPIDNDYVFGVGAGLNSIREFGATLRRTAIWTLVISLLVSTLTGLAFGRFFTSKLRKIITALESAAAGKLDTRLTVNSRIDEFNLLTSKLNWMFARVETLLSHLKQVSAGLAHDVRTPLSVLKNQLSELREQGPADDEHLRRADQALDDVLAYFDSVLFITELESGELVSRFQAVAFSRLVKTMTENYRPLLEDAGVAYSERVQPGLQVAGAADLLQRLLANILDNVLLHRRGQSQSVGLSLERDKQSALLIVTNEDSALTETPPMPETYQPQQTQRRGMGLKIIKAIAELHGGELIIERSPGQFRYRVRLPLR